MAICWIAGWPHNGSTLLRQIIKQCFDITAYSKYPEPDLNFLFGEAVARFGKEWAEDPWRKYLWCRDSRIIWLIKTHENPIDRAPAIFVVRDGRNAVTALSHFWHIPIADCITGQGCYFGSWSTYFWAWNPLERPNTLLIKYEDMVTKPDEIAQQIGKMLQISPTAKFIDKFEENRNSCPQLFQDIDDCWQNEMSARDISLFWDCHGEVMRRLGYSRKGPERQIVNE